MVVFGGHNGRKDYSGIRNGGGDRSLLRAKHSKFSLNKEIMGYIVL